MSDIFKNKQVEDILSDEFLVEEIQKNASEKAGSDSEELKLAVRILSLFKQSHNRISNDDKKEIQDRFEHSIGNYKRRILITRISVAASFFILLGSAALVRLVRQPEIVSYAESFADVSSLSNTKLFLSGHEVEIASNESAINYSANGNVIAIDASQQVNQKVDSKNVVMNTILVPFGKRAQITLSDESKVWLNSGSKLVFPAKFENKAREVYLEGEGIFEVKHDTRHPFHVLTHDLDVRVLGTVFNVSAYSDDSIASTVLVKGSVELGYPGNKLFGKSKFLMTPGMLVNYDASQKRVASLTVDTEQYTSWKDGYLVFKQQKLGEIVKKISRYYNVRIKMEDPSLADEVFSGNLELKNSATEVLQIVSQIVSAQIETNSNQLIIKRI